MLTKVLNKQHIVALLVVDELVDELLCHQKAETAWPKALSFTSGEMADKVANGAIDRSMAKLFKRKALPGILDAASDRATGVDKGNFHILAGVEIPSMLDGVQQNFMKSKNHFFPVSFGDSGKFGSAEELDKPNSSFNIAASHHLHPA